MNQQQTNQVPSEVPHLATALTGPLQELEKTIIEHQVEIESWFRQQWQHTPPPFYSSVDLRNAGFKLAPVDTNLFPAGFNNLNPDFMPLCVQAVQATMAEICPEARRILLIPESHTRNLFYFESLVGLRNVIQNAGFDVRIGTFNPDVAKPTEFSTPSGQKLLLEPLVRDGDRVGVEGFSPCTVLLNNDLSGGVPEMLEGVKQVVMPSLELGWSQRLKSEHFRHYAGVAEQFAKPIGLDPWLVSPLFDQCTDLDFMSRDGHDCLVLRSEALLQTIHDKYKEYGIKQEPFLVVKADDGTYGMAVLMIKNPKELRELNRKQRTHMSATKGGRPVTKAIIQEGVYTFETVGDENAVAEPVVYQIGRHVVGGFYRVHKNRGSDENLNAPGMDFQPLAFHESCQYQGCDETEAVNRFYAYGVVARLAALAAAKELQSFGSTNQEVPCHGD